jgi:hypothetical protein
MSNFHSTDLGGASTADRQNLQLELRSAASVRWRKLLLRRQWELSFICESFAGMWSQHFPHHDVLTLRLERRPQSRAESYWDAESWKRAARWYHENRQGRTLITEPDPQQVRRVPRLLSNDVSLDAVWRELNAPKNQPTPQVTVEAVMLCVRERGIAALQEPDNKERLSRCDAAARRQINERIGRLLGKKNAGAAAS